MLVLSFKQDKKGIYSMQNEYDFSNSRKNPYAKVLNKQISIRIDENTIHYFKNLAEDLNISYQSVINLYLNDCAQSNRRLNLK